MSEQELLLFDDIIKKYIELKQFRAEKTSFWRLHIIRKITTINFDFYLKRTKVIKELIVSAINLQILIEKERKLKSSDLNVFRMFGLGETKHSFLLANFLNPNAEHGQKHLFINEFLDLIGIKRYSDNENWIVTAEKGRIDILLKRETPHAVVVIENKSNYAVDQENQIYRYWHQEIYKAIQSKNLPESYIQNPPKEKYQLIYLAPIYWKMPAENSLSRPDYLSVDLPQIVPMEIQVKVFEEIIVQWLCNCLSKVHNENTRLINHIEQYIELWK